MLNIEQRGNTEAAILDLTGTFTPGADDAVLAAVTALMVQGCRKLILNLGQARNPGTPAITALVRTLRAVRDCGGELRLVGLDPRFARLLQIVALYTYFDTCATEAEAVADFAAGPGGLSSSGEHLCPA